MKGSGDLGVERWDSTCHPEASEAAQLLFLPITAAAHYTD